MKIKISHLAKIEGHASFFADILKGDIKGAKVKVTIGARLIESIILNRNYIEAPIVTSRICGICSVAHNLCSIKAIEDALNIKITDQAEKLRKVLILSESIQSHAAHIFFLSLSDFFKYESDIDLIKKYPDLTKKIILLRDFGNQIKDKIGGRDMHLLSPEVGGFRRIPEDKIIKRILTQVEPVLDAAIEIVKFFKKLDYPKYKRNVEFAGLASPKEYAYYDGKIGSSIGRNFKIKNFYQEIVEKQTAYDPTKRVRHKGESFMVGAIARLNLSHHLLNKEAKKLLDFFTPSPQPSPQRGGGAKLPRSTRGSARNDILTYNTFHNIYAQAVELVHCVEEVNKLLKEYLKNKSRKLCVNYKLKNGRGLAAIEAPRGMLFHAYDVDRYGMIKACNVISPTAIFLDNLENDLKKYLREVKVKSARDRKWKINMMIRAYDPCMTCATH